ncbi:MAG: hypothetical protein DWQ37_17140 [Planctomycetota bacterium]|nr:MAG: hypothetical protein DWQ37_17140 [Planctomycetota bacterium]
MRNTTLLLPPLGMILATVLLAGPLPAAEKAPSPESLVHEALVADLNGATQDRDRLLAEALELDPDYAPARWQSGYLRVGRNWVPVDEAPEKFAGNTRLALYRQKRDAMVDTADQHRALARWCHKSRLRDEERIHWQKVLEYEPRNAEAIAGLGLQPYEGRWLTREQIAEAQQRQRERAAALRRWMPQVQKWRDALVRGDADEVAAAHAELAQLSDPDVLPALEKVFLAESPKQYELELQLIEVASRIEDFDSTQLLLRRALAGPTRQAACEALKKRPLHQFVPQLIAMLPGKYQTQFRINVLPGGTVVHEHEVSFSGQQRKQKVTYESTVHPVGLPEAQAITPRAIASERQKAQAMEAEVGRREAVAGAVRARVSAVLEETTGFENPDDPELLRHQYAEYYGWSTSQNPVPEQQAHVYDYAGYYLPRARVRRTPERQQTNRSEPTRQTPTIMRPTAANPTNRANRDLFPRPIRGECFPAGTAVPTLTGERPIEDLKPGDRVLSQDLATGELAYETVLERTLRQGVQMVSVKFGDSEIASTYGHPFWVVGRGWRVAGHLKPGDRLRGLDGDVVVESVEEAPATEVYNLVVSDMATFFVGKQRLLVHDDTGLSAVPVVLPGLAMSKARE